MIGRLAAALLSLAACIGGLYAAVAFIPSADANGHGGAGTELRTDFIATPILTDDSIEGYVIGRYLITLDPAVAGQLGPAIPATLNHGINVFFFRNAAETFWMGGPVAVPEISAGLKQAINRTAGGPLVASLSIRQLDFLTTGEVRQPVISVER